MSHFYVTAQGGRGAVSRTGTKSSGADAHARGWNLGGRVRAYATQRGRGPSDAVECDAVQLEVTGGTHSLRRTPTLAITAVEREDGGLIVTFVAGTSATQYGVSPQGEIE